jgi:hypothetical protein
MTSCAPNSNQADAAPSDAELAPVETKPSIIVSGLGRCGSSLVMQMLQAAGVPCVGHYPAFEEPESHPTSMTADWLEARRGEAFKILDPQLSNIHLNRLHAVVIFLQRDAGQQAASMAKFGRMVMGLHSDRRHIRRLADSFRRDLPLARDKYAGLPMLVLSFERLIVEPRFAAAAMAELLTTHGFTFNADAAVNVVRMRSPDCYPGLLEIDLLDAMRREVLP